MKLAHIVGARPQFIKCLPLMKAIEAHNNSEGAAIKELLIHTGQHYDYTMSKLFFEELEIKESDYHLGVGSASHGEQVGRIIEKAEAVLIKEKPDIVLVYGDTNSTLGGAIAASKLHIPVAHIEAGLRSFNKNMPEEINRRVADHVSSLLFSPSEAAANNLAREGFKRIINGGKLIGGDSDLPDIDLNISEPAVINVGDVMYDTFIAAIEIAEKKSDILERLHLGAKEYNLVTLHRQENVESPARFRELIKFVNDTSRNKIVIFPMHPRTRKLYADMKDDFSSNVRVINPVGYFDILTLLKNSSLVMTDSGGMQKEAYWLKVPCTTLRDETEWVETLRSGWNVLWRDYKGRHKITDAAESYYGEGKAADKIVKVLTNRK